jgi:digeranylgeranylglycerophospholipid reductase
MFWYILMKLLFIKYMHDLAVIGAGPVGSYLASLCAGSMDVIVLEEDTEAGKKACSGLVSPRLIGMFPPSVKIPGLVRHEVKAGLVHFMGKEFEFRKSATAAYILDRDILDKRMAEHAERSGADMRFGEKVLQVVSAKEKVELRTARRRFEAKVVAGCDGARSVAAKSMGSKPTELLNGLIMYLDREDYSDSVEMWFDKSLVKDGFFWRIPRGQQTEVGCIGYGLSFPILERFFRIEKSGIVLRKAAPVPIGIVDTTGSRTILVGDAACQTKPWSGGGITYGMMAARYASEAISSAVRTGLLSKLSAYDDMWRGRLLRDIKAGLVLRELYKDLNLSALGAIMEKAESLKHEGDSIDFDFPFSSMMIG